MCAGTRCIVKRMCRDALCDRMLYDQTYMQGRVVKGCICRNVLYVKMLYVQ